MKPFLEQVTCYITTLAPVHMGAGEDYYPTQYVIDDSYLYAFDELDMVNTLGAGIMNDLAKLADKGGDSITAIQKKVYENRDKLKQVARTALPVASGIAQKYSATINGGKNEMAIQRTFYNPFDGKPVLTGSGIKGAIRTALLDQLNAGKTLSSALHNERNAAGLLQKQLLGYKGVADDPLRLVKVSDGGYAHEENLLPTDIRYAVSRKRNPIPGRSPNTTTIMMECISPWRARCFGIGISLHDRTLADRNAANLPVDFSSLADVCNRYYRPRLEKEIRFLNEKGYASVGKAEAAWSKGLRTLLQGELGQALSGNRAFLLKLGKHGGAEDKTLDGVRSIKIMQGKGQKPESRPNTTEVRLAANNTGDTDSLMPFGWVLVEIGRQHLPETMQFIREMAEPDYQRLGQVALQAQQRQKLLQEQAEKQRQEQEKREAEQSAELQHQQALAAMSEEQKAMFQLRQRMEANEGRNAGPGVQLAIDLGRLIEQAASAWQATDKQAIRELAVAIYQHLGVDVKKNQKVKERLRSLG